MLLTICPVVQTLAMLTLIGNALGKSTLSSHHPSKVVDSREIFRISFPKKVPGPEIETGSEIVV